MMTSGISFCPYCNARLEPLGTVPLSEKIPCPRCGEPVSTEQWRVAPETQPVQAADAVGPVAKRKTVFVLLGIMVFMAVVGLSYALYTARLREERHPKPRVIPGPVAVPSPAELPALGYLPSGAGIVAGFRFAALAQDPMGKKLLEEPYPPLFAEAARLLKSAGLKVEDLDHAAVGVVAGSILPEVIFIARTRVPYDLEKMARSVQPAQASVYKKRPLYDFAWPPAGAATLWGIDETTLSFIVRPLTAGENPDRHAVLDTLAATPRDVKEILEQPLRKLLEERVPKQSLAWVAGETEKSIGKVWWAPAADMKRFALGVYPQDGLTTLGSIFVGTEKAARELQARLESYSLPAGVTLKVEGPPPGNAQPEAQWVSLQIRTGNEGLRELLRQWAPAAK